MMQIPNLPNYLQVPQQPNYNAVKIDVLNPMVNVPAQAPAYQTEVMPQQSQYATPVMPYYNYPQSQLYSYPQAPVQPYYMPPQAPVMMPPVIAETPQAPSVDVAPQAPQVPTQPVPVTVQEVPLPPESVVVPPAPVVTEAPKAEDKKVTTPAAPEVKTETTQEPKPVEVVPSAPITPQIDLNSFIAKLTNPDYEIQASAMEEIANMVKDEPQKATELLDTKVIDALNNIITADTSKLKGPTAEQSAAREKLFANQQMTDDEKNLAMTIAPQEQAERNKSYAMFTTAILQKLYGDEVQKLTNSTVPLTELPGAVTIVEQLKNNPNPIVRTSALEALSYIQNPSYKKDLNTIFTIAQKDQDKGVQEAATAALAKLNEVADMPVEAQETKQAA